jgi:hypothetical protein
MSDASARNLAAIAAAAQKSAAPKTAKPAKYVKSPERPSKAAPTLERARATAPDFAKVTTISMAYALDRPEYEETRDLHYSIIIQAYGALGNALDEAATAMHFQRIVGAFVSSACGAAEYYSDRKLAAAELTNAVLNDDRDEDRDPVAGYETKAQRAREYAAKKAMQAYALLAAAEGATIAYKEITGKEWMPYVAQADASQSVSRKTAAAEMAAFD